MKISIYALHLIPGGVEKYVIELAKTLSKEHQVSLVLTFKAPIEMDTSFNENVTLRYLLPEWLRPYKIEFKQSIIQFKVISILMYGTLNTLYVLMKTVMNTLYIMFDQSEILISTRIFHNRLMNRFSRKIKIATEHNHHNHNQKYIQKVIKTTTKFKALIPISKELQVFYETRVNKHVYVESIPFFVEEKFITDQTKEKDLIFISVGRFEQEKNLFGVLESFRLIHEQYPQSILYLVGDGSQRINIEAYIQEQNLRDSVILTGVISSDDLVSYYEKSKYYLMTSHTESFGIVLLEAAGSGVIPLIYKSAQGAVEIVDNHTSLIAYECNPKSIYYLFKKIESDASLYKALQSDVRKIVDKYSHQSFEHKWLNIVCQLRNEEA